MHIGLYFGSFNPIHIGHLVIGSFVANTYVDEVWMVVSPRNPLKEAADLLDESARLQLVKLAVANDPQLKASDVEFNLPRPSYTVDTMAFLRGKYPDHTFSMIMGSDSFLTLDSWKKSKMLLEENIFFVYERPYFSLSTVPANVTILKGPFLNISATTIRDAIRTGKSIRYLVTESVMHEILDKGYYQ